MINAALSKRVPPPLTRPGDIGGVDLDTANGKLKKVRVQKNLYPLIAPIVMPCRKYRWKAKNIMMVGSAAMLEAAITSP